ncbi:MAG: hypothetical protein L3J87_05010, partial [Thermoplasmata archaeon]|nr:hypothetical protein [Thermoplasmata archaeon]
MTDASCSAACSPPVRRTASGSPGSEGARRPAGRRAGLLAIGLVFWIAIGVMAIPDLSGVALNLTGPIATPIGSPSAHHVTAGSHLPSGPSASSVSTSASNGFLPSVPSTSSHLAFQSEINIYERSRQAWAERNASEAANATAAQARAHPDLTIPTGKFSGYVYNSLTGAAVQGVTVEAYSVGAAICPATTCAP